LHKIRELRKNLKIKAGIILLSWIMIFAHGIIPHNHVDANSCHAGFIHTLLNHHNSENGSPEFRELCCDYESCSISNILFQKLGTDGNPVLPENRLYIYHTTPSCQLIVESDQQIPDRSLPGSALLRAPPTA